ncbi:MAG: PAS domain S-box protein [Polaromonas sp.]|nr:PAS domain S-box protein [Polaromonas sp.]
MNMNVFQWRSLKTRVTIFTLAIFLASIWALAFYSSRMLREDMQRLSSEQQFSTVSFVAAEVNHELDERLKALEKVAASVSPTMLDRRASMQTLLEERQNLQDFFNGTIFVTGMEGTVIASIPLSVGQIGVNYLDRDYIAVALKEGKATIGRPVIGKKLQAPIIGMAVPIRDAQGKVVGALAGVTDLSKPNFLDIFTEYRYGKTGGYLLIAPQYRLIVTATDKSRIMETLPAPGVMPVIDRFVQGYEGSDVFVNPLGVEVLTSVKGVPVAGWYMAAILPTAEGLAPIHDMQQKMLLTTLFLTLMATVLTWWMVSRQLSPMLAAVRTLATLSNTNQPPQPLTIARPDEIGELIGGFNRLLETLGQREVALYESEERYRTLIEWSPEAIVVYRGREVVYANPTAIKMFGAWSAQDLIGKSLLDLIHPDFHQIVLTRLKSITDHGVTLPMIEEKYLKLDGTVIDVEVKSTAIVYNEKMAMYTVARDITERKQAHEEILRLNAGLEERVRQRTTQLQAANQDLESFSYSVSHDLRTPLSTIAGFSQLLAKVDGNNFSEKGKHYLNRICAGAKQMGELIEGLLTLAQLNREQIKLENVDLSAISKQVEQACREREPERQVQVHIQEGLHAHGDPRLLSAVLQNLLGNAWKFTAKQVLARIDVGSELGADGDTIFFVKDNGAGFDMAFADKLFGTFQRLHSHEDFSGTGVGLATVKRIVERHEGRVWAESKLNEGATFYFTLGRPIESVT